MDRFGGKPAFSLSNIAADAFWLGTLGVAVVSAHIRESRVNRD
jgi:hypothetical protein